MLPLAGHGKEGSRVSCLSACLPRRRVGARATVTRLWAVGSCSNLTVVLGNRLSPVACRTLLRAERPFESRGEDCVIGSWILGVSRWRDSPPLLVQRSEADKHDGTYLRSLVLAGCTSKCNRRQLTASFWYGYRRRRCSHLLSAERLTSSYRTS